MKRRGALFIFAFANFFINNNVFCAPQKLKQLIVHLPQVSVQTANPLMYLAKYATNGYCKFHLARIEAIIHLSVGELLGEKNLLDQPPLIDQVFIEEAKKHGNTFMAEIFDSKNLGY